MGNDTCPGVVMGPKSVVWLGLLARSLSVETLASARDGGAAACVGAGTSLRSGTHSVASFHSMRRKKNPSGILLEFQWA